MVVTILAFTLGFVSGVTYARERPEPWQDLANSLKELGVTAHRAYKGGPEKPTPTTNEDNLRKEDNDQNTQRSGI
jgi:hypothetical protein